jgi:hypothetical protein
LFNRFLKSSVSAVSFGAVFESDKGHINSQLVRRAHDYRCRFDMEGGTLVASKQNDDSDQTFRDWTKMRDKANIEVQKLGFPALQEILGDADYIRIRLFPLEDRIPAVLIETLEEPRETRPLNAPQTLVSGPPTPLSSSTPQDPRRRHPSYKNWGAPSTPAMIPASHLSTAAGYNLFSDRLGVRLRTLSSFKTPESIEAAVSKRWELMGAEEQQHYIVKAVKMLPPAGGAEASARVPFNPHRDRAPSTPKPPPCGASTPPQSVTFHEPRKSAGGGAAGSNALPGTKQPVSTPAPRVAAATATRATLPTASSSPFLAPVSLSRLNSILERRRQNIKTEGSSQAIPRAAKRKVMEYIDLTEEDY